jgi:hypothetical protein
VDVGLSFVGIVKSYILEVLLIYVIAGLQAGK